MLGGFPVAVVGCAASRSRLALEALCSAAGAGWDRLVALGLCLCADGAGDCPSLRHSLVGVVGFRLVRRALSGRVGGRHLGCLDLCSVIHGEDV